MQLPNNKNPAAAEQLKEICSTLEAPKGFLDIVGYHLLGHQKSQFNATNETFPMLKEIIEFMSKLFIHFTSKADLTIVALDDIQYIDNMSWQVMQRIYESVQNILFVCSSRRTGPRVFMGNEFWKNLIGSQRMSGRFQELNMGPLNQSEITTLASIVFSCKVEEVDKGFIKVIFDHTRGMPHFASQALQNCKRNNLYRRLDNNKIGWRQEYGQVRLM